MGAALGPDLEEAHRALAHTGGLHVAGNEDKLQRPPQLEQHHADELEHSYPQRQREDLARGQSWPHSPSTRSISVR